MDRSEKLYIFEADFGSWELRRIVRSAVCGDSVFGLHF